MNRGGNAPILVSSGDYDRKFLQQCGWVFIHQISLKRSSPRNFLDASSKVRQHGWSRERSMGGRRDEVGDRTKPREDRIGCGTIHSTVPKSRNFWCPLKSCRYAHRSHLSDRKACALEVVSEAVGPSPLGEGSHGPENRVHRSLYTSRVFCPSKIGSRMKRSPDRLDRTVLSLPRRCSG